jgi:hypothetical protein
MNQTLVIQHLPPEAVHKLLDYLPDYVKGALQEKATELDCPLEAVVEMALASFLDAESFSFEDCLLAQRLSEAAPGHYSSIAPDPKSAPAYNNLGNALSEQHKIQRELK